MCDVHSGSQSPALRARAQPAGVPRVAWGSLCSGRAPPPLRAPPPPSAPCHHWLPRHPYATPSTPVSPANSAPLGVPLNDDALTALPHPHMPLVQEGAREPSRGHGAAGAAPALGSASPRPFGFARPAVDASLPRRAVPSSPRPRRPATARDDTVRMAVVPGREW